MPTLAQATAPVSGNGVVIKFNQNWAARPAQGERPGQAELTTAVAWSFMQLILSEVAKAEDFPTLRDHAERLEQTDLFKRYPIV